VRAYYDPTYNMWFQHVMCCVKLILAGAALEV
jgi:hypothetical protein